MPALTASEVADELDCSDHPFDPTIVDVLLGLDTLLDQFSDLTNLPWCESNRDGH
jgi:hypothetical protein